MTVSIPAPPRHHNNEWGTAAWTAAWERLRERVVERADAPPSTTAETWEADLRSEDSTYNRAVARWHDEIDRRIRGLVPTATHVITAGLVEPFDAYWGTRSCWVNAGRRAADRVPL